MDLYGTLAAAFRSHLQEPWIELPDGTTLPYAAVDDGSAKVAGLLRSLGVRRGDRVAVQVEKTPDALLAYLGTVRARFGYLASPTLLAYATGGLAYGNVSGSAGFTTTNPAYPAIGFGPTWGTANFFSATRAGWTLGAGFEWMFAPSFSVKAEYLYYDLGSVTYVLGSSGAVALPGFVGAGSQWFTNASTVSTRYSGNILRVGLNYHLGGLPGFPRF